MRSRAGAVGACRGLVLLVRPVVEPIPFSVALLLVARVLLGATHAAGAAAQMVNDRGRWHGGAPRYLFAVAVAFVFTVFLLSPALYLLPVSEQPRCWAPPPFHEPGPGHAWSLTRYLRGGGGGAGPAGQVKAFPPCRSALAGGFQSATPVLPPCYPRGGYSLWWVPGLAFFTLGIYG